MALPGIGDGEQIGDGNLDETLNVGRAGQPVQVAGSSGTLGFFGESPVSQQSAITAVATTSATSTTNAYGYTTAAQADGIVTAVNDIITKLQNLGLTA